MNKRDSKQELSVKYRVCQTVVSAKKKNKAWKMSRKRVVRGGELQFQKNGIRERLKGSKGSK